MMKKLMYLLLLVAAVLTSCKKDDVGDLTGTYTFTEQGVLTIAGQSQTINGSGVFNVYRLNSTTIRITGDVEAKAYAGTNSRTFTLQDDQQEIDNGDGMIMYVQNSYSNEKFDGYSMSWKTNSVVVATYGGITSYGTYQSTTKAVRK